MRVNGPNNGISHFYNNLAEITQVSQKSRNESFTPLESSMHDNSYTARNLFENPTSEDLKMFDKKWVNRIALREKSPKEFEEHLVKKGYTKEQASMIIGNAMSDIDRRQGWAERNKKHGLLSSGLVSGSIFFSVLKHFIPESASTLFKTGVNFIQGLCKGIRSNVMYGVYSKPDDDISMNQYQEDVYDNKTSGFTATCAKNTEMYINPWFYPVIELLPLSDNLKDSFKKLASLPSSTYWRVRQPAEISQPFFTNLLRYMAHIIPSVCGREKSKKVISAVKEEGNIAPSYVWSRICENAGIKEKENQTFGKYIKKLYDLTTGMFSSDLKVSQGSSDKLGKTIAPALGLYGTGAIVIGGVAQAVSKLLGRESKLFDFLYASSYSSQWAIYLPKLITPVYNRARELEEDLKNPNLGKNYTAEETLSLKKLGREFRNLSYFGVGAFFVQHLNMLFKLKTFENPILQKAVGIIDGIHGELVNQFFSHRRHVLGKDFELTNKEFYDPVVEGQVAETPSIQPSPNGTLAKKGLETVLDS